MSLDFTKLIDLDLLSYFKAKLDLLLAGKVNAESGKRLMTDAEGTKLSGIATGAQVNVIEGVQVNGTTVNPVNKIVNLPIPDGASASDATPAMNGTGAAGSSNAFARGDHVHPSDTSKVDVSTYNTYVNNVDNALGTIANDLVFAQGDIDTLSADVYRKSQVYTKTEVDAKVASIWHIKPGVATVADLPSSGNTEGDVRHVTANGGEYYWTGSAWEELGATVDLSGYVEVSDLGAATQAEIDALFT